MNPDDLLPKHVTAPVTRIPSPQQLAIYEAAASTTDNILIEAVAGSGKSTTIIELSNRANDQSLFLAFNKAIAEELRPRIPRSDVRTLNALGHRVLMSKRRGASLNQWKTSNWLKAHMSPDVYEGVGKEVARVVSIAKGQGLGIHDLEAKRDRTISPANFRAIVDAYMPELDPEKIVPVASMALTAFNAVVADQNEFDFDDQLYVPIKEGWQFPAYGTVYVDEAQDLNPIQHLMLEALAQRGARIIAVGDRRQAIYGFRGALANSMNLLRDTFNMREYPLSVTYRCSTEVTRFAKMIVPQIEHRENAPVGEVKSLDKYPNVGEYENGDLIVCRNNVPIFELALQFIRARQPCRVLANFLDEFEKFVNSFKAKEIPVLIQRLDAWYEKQKKDCEERGQWGKLEGLSDRYHVVKTFAPEFRTVAELNAAVYRLSTSTVGPRISTIHKAKGLEATNVYLLRWDLLPSPRATSDEAIIQEDNLRYVAITRAKQNLRILPLGD